MNPQALGETHGTMLRHTPQGGPASLSDERASFKSHRQENGREPGQTRNQDRFDASAVLFLQRSRLRHRLCLRAGRPPDRKDMLTIRVGIKETEDPIPLCYCFGYDRKGVRDDIQRNGKTDILKTITQRVKDGECRCEETNPSGGCCLGDVNRAIKHAHAMREQELL